MSKKLSYVDICCINDNCPNYQISDPLNILDTSYCKRDIPVHLCYIRRLESENQKLKEKAYLWDSLGVIDKELIKILVENKGEAIQLLTAIPQEELKLRLFNAWYEANIKAGEIIFESEKRARNAESKLAEVEKLVKSFPKFDPETDETNDKFGEVWIGIPTGNFDERLEQWKHKLKKIIGE